MPRTNFSLWYNSVMYYVYVIKNEIKELYYGYTSDLRKRLVEHNAGNTFSTRCHSWKLIYYEAYLSKKDALKRESQMKHYGQSLSHLKRRLKFSLEDEN